MFPHALLVGNEISIYYRISWTGETKVYSGDEHSQSISRVRYLRGVNELTFGVMDLFPLTGSKCIGISQDYQEEVLTTIPYKIKAEDDEQFKLIHGKGYQGISYTFSPSPHLSYRLFYYLVLATQNNTEEEF